MGANALYSVEIGQTEVRVSQSGADYLIDAGRSVSLQFPGVVHLLDEGPMKEAA
jgi:putative spermidine/putrescine transport system ATP-binding protein